MSRLFFGNGKAFPWEISKIAVSVANMIVYFLFWIRIKRDLTSFIYSC